jgi:RNA polymerase sigma-70 factor (ECF subfamily)
MKHVTEQSSSELGANATDEELVSQFLSGNREAFAQLYRRYYERTYRLAYGMTGDRAAAEDMAQEVFMRAYQRLEQFEGRAQFSTWFYRVTINHCLRRRVRPAAIRAETPLENGPEPGGPPRVEDGILKEQVHLQVHRALLSLRPVPRMIVVLKDIEGLSYGEIAERMNCSEGTVASRLNRARRLLGRKLAHLKGAV